MDYTTVSSLSKKGIFPFPKETDEEFSIRALAMQEKEAAKELPCIPKGELFEACQKIEKKYGIFPSWIHCYYSQQELAQVFAGYCEIDENSQPIVVLRKGFAKKSSYLGYTRTETLSHEMVHAVRINFEESVYEEMMAYHLSPYWWRRSLGPWADIISIPFTIGGVGVWLIFHLMQIFMYETRGILLVAGISSLILCFYFSVTLAQLAWHHYILYRCKKRLCNALGSAKKAWHCLIHLTKKEIKNIALKKSKPIEEEIGKSTSDDFRKMYLKTLFFSKKG
jgi:hypothetical protein